MNNKQILRELLAISLPAMVENILQMTMGMVDSYLVASLGLVALSGVSVANNILAIYQAIFIALAAAVSARLAGSLGKSSSVQEPTLMQQSVNLTVFISLLLPALAVLGGPSLLRLLGTEIAVRQAGATYLALVGGTIVFQGLMASLGAMLRAQGNPRLPMYISLLVNVLNAILSAVAVFVLHIGVVGVAMGTILSRLVGCILLWFQLGLGLRTWTWSIDKHLLTLALPAAGERLMMRLGDVVVMSLIVSLGTAVVAGNAIGETLTQFNYMPAMGIAVATVILAARSSGDQTTLTKIYRNSFGLAVLFMGIMAGLTYILAPNLIGFYTDSLPARQTAQTVLFYSLIGVPITAGTLILTAYWQGLGYTQLPFYVTSLGMWLVRILVAFVLIHFLKIGYQAIWIGTLLDNAFRMTVLHLLYLRRKNRSL